VQSLRALGSCALNMCSVAVGRMDGYFEGRDRSYGPKPWDMAAALLILREAGGTARDINGSDIDICSGRVLAANTPELAESLVKLLAQ
jgi:fructose-1,6-bisphosphatase/inositol monophosphatase family enzyme